MQQRHMSRSHTTAGSAMEKSKQKRCQLLMAYGLSPLASHTYRIQIAGNEYLRFSGSLTCHGLQFPRQLNFAAVHDHLSYFYSLCRSVV